MVRNRPEVWVNVKVLKDWPTESGRAWKEFKTEDSAMNRICVVSDVKTTALCWIHEYHILSQIVRSWTRKS